MVSPLQMCVVATTYSRLGVALRESQRNAATSAKVHPPTKKTKVTGGGALLAASSLLPPARALVEGTPAAAAAVVGGAPKATGPPRELALTLLLLSAARTPAFCCVMETNGPGSKRNVSSRFGGINVIACSSRT